MPPFPLPDPGQLLAGFPLPTLPLDPAALLGSAQQGSAAAGGGSAQMSSGSVTGSLSLPVGSAVMSLAALVLPMIGAGS